jgi:hypothetical protein
MITAPAYAACETRPPKLASSSAISDAGLAALNRKPCTLEVAGLAGRITDRRERTTLSSDIEKIASSALCWVACSLT